MTRYDIAGNRRNLRVFLAELDAAPAKALILCAVFAALAVLASSMERVRNPLIISALAAAASAFFAWRAALAIRSRRAP